MLTPAEPQQRFPGNHSPEACNWLGPDRMKRNSICSLGVGIAPPNLNWKGSCKTEGNPWSKLASAVTGLLCDYCNFFTNYRAVSARSTSQPRYSRLAIVLGLIFNLRPQSPMLVEIPFQVIILALAW
jgi:hypothetical protein